MRRTQLYLDDDLWTVLRLQARIEKTTISDLVRRAVRERYSVDREKRKSAMEAVIGIKTGLAKDPKLAKNFFASFVSLRETFSSSTPRTLSFF